MSVASGGQVVVEFSPEGSLGDAPYVVYEELTQRAVMIGGTKSVNVSGPEGAQGYYNCSGGSMSPTRRIRILGYSFDGVLQLALDLKRSLMNIPRVRKDEINVNAALGWGGEQVDRHRDAAGSRRARSHRRHGAGLRRLGGAPGA